MQEQSVLPQLPWTRQVGGQRQDCLNCCAARCLQLHVEKACRLFLKAADIGENPLTDSREPGHPVGLKVRGSWRPAHNIQLRASSRPELRRHLLCECLPTGLPNSSHCTRIRDNQVQVWFQDLPFRSGVYRCQLPQDAKFKLEVRFHCFQVIHY